MKYADDYKNELQQQQQQQQQQPMQTTASQRLAQKPSWEGPNKKDDNSKQRKLKSATSHKQ